jgi:hypothetical protein
VAASRACCAAVKVTPYDEKSSGFSWHFSVSPVRPPPAAVRVSPNVGKSASHAPAR